ncbi:pyridoxal phosphate-dependent class II aminotransferase [Paenibacillus sp. JCM 10914]|uniref:threonine-phosphate decarboxylase CobD n=1 Tax=Paenibacillus sp. JCM 10914 TaxID=1236974 RepID=UPI0003CC9D27|nr:threonine-phosphate decarboxylase CobD [Paenibacillus sp. JCM 10914]GAE05621.1 L-threonine 3-O-phosphate decarboxylase [Paenibacillus sp. JCM 10914]
MTYKDESRIEVYGHGGDIETAEATFGRRAASFLDFSANINPLGPPADVITVLQESLPAVIRYPDPGHRRFKDLLSTRIGIARERLMAGNGAAECMALLLLGLSPKVVGVVDPCFSEYRELSFKFGADVRSITGHSGQDWRAGRDQVIELVQACDLLFLGQPNNPNGVQYDLDDIRAIAEAAERKKTWLVLDEAFIDFIPPEHRHTLLPELHRYRQTVIIRSMTKFYAIPGLRLGYTVGHPDVIRAMAAKQVSWSVNGLALLAGEACLGSGEAYERRTQELIRTQREQLAEGLRAAGFVVAPSEVNYLLVEVPYPWSAAAFQQELGTRGVLIRSCAMYPGLGPQHIRVAVKDAEANATLLAVVHEVMDGV